MTALGDIIDTLKALPPVIGSRERVVLIGISARRSLDLSVLAGEIGKLDTIGGFFVRDTIEFEGWAIRDVDVAGQWHDVERAA